MGCYYSNIDVCAGLVADCKTVTMVPCVGDLGGRHEDAGRRTEAQARAHGGNEAGVSHRESVERGKQSTNRPGLSSDTVKSARGPDGKGGGDEQVREKGVTYNTDEHGDRIVAHPATALSVKGRLGKEVVDHPDRNRVSRSPNEEDRHKVRAENKKQKRGRKSGYQNGEQGAAGKRSHHKLGQGRDKKHGNRDTQVGFISRISTGGDDSTKATQRGKWKEGARGRDQRRRSKRSAQQAVMSGAQWGRATDQVEVWERNRSYGMRQYNDAKGAESAQVNTKEKGHTRRLKKVQGHSKERSDKVPHGGTTDQTMRRLRRDGGKAPPRQCRNEEGGVTVEENKEAEHTTTFTEKDAGKTAQQHEEPKVIRQGTLEVASNGRTGTQSLSAKVKLPRRGEENINRIISRKEVRTKSENKRCGIKTIEDENTGKTCRPLAGTRAVTVAGEGEVHDLAVTHPGTYRCTTGVPRLMGTDCTTVRRRATL
ncbi:hypothetical protein Tco_0685893 [Tanacetum coccineum]